MEEHDGEGRRQRLGERGEIEQRGLRHGTARDPVGVSVGPAEEFQLAGRPGSPRRCPNPPRPAACGGPRRPWRRAGVGVFGAKYRPSAVEKKAEGWKEIMIIHGNGSGV
ncbi:MAG: hypothetical protein MZV70_50540 [Desulfobacterales bacterium]|nr:hypothetical protein [Desulfobacterales bacterium]